MTNPAGPGPDLTEAECAVRALSERDSWWVASQIINEAELAQLIHDYAIGNIGGCPLHFCTGLAAAIVEAVCPPEDEDKV